MFILIRLSMQFGNIAKRPDLVLRINNNGSAIMMYLPAVILFMTCFTDGSVIFSDFVCGWNLFCAASPLNKRKFVLVKFLAQLMTNVTAFCLSAAYGLIYCGVSGIPFSSGFILNLLLMLMLAIIVSSAYMALSFVYKKKNAVEIRLVGAAVVIYIPFMAAITKAMSSYSQKYSELDEDTADIVFRQIMFEKFSAIKDLITPIVPFAAAAAVFAAFFICVRSLERSDR